MRPTLAVAVICRNESRDLPRALASVASIADFLCVIDTGSTDDTVEIARKALPIPTTVRTYLDASEKNADGSWSLWSFSNARNEALKDAEATGATHVMWLDADDEVITPSAIRRVLYWDEFDAFSVWLDGGGSRWTQHRLWKADKHVRFKGRCHEYPVLDGLKCASIDESLIRHHAEPGEGQENSNPRNERILLREWEEEQTPRTAFYLANTYRDSGRHEQAAEWYGKRMAFGHGYRDEWLFSALYRARCLRALKRHKEAAAECYGALAVEPGWCEFTMELGFCAYERGAYQEAIGHAMQAIGKTPTETALWRELPMYRDQPLRLISWAHEHLGDLPASLEWAEKAAAAIGGPDADWELRSRRLRSQIAAKDAPAPAVIKRLRRQIALHRPGAIGDILMTLNLIPALRDANPDTDIHYFCSPAIGAPDALGGIMLAAGVDLVMDCAQMGAWRSQYDRVIDLIGYPLAEGYPEKPMRMHLLQYFADEMDLHTYFVTPGAMPSLTLPRPERPKGWEAGGKDYYTIQLKAGWSAYKQWPEDRWHEVMERLFHYGITFQLIDESTKLSLADSIALFANAKMHLGIDSFAGHLTNYFWTYPGGGRKVPGVILWGSTQVSAAGYDSNCNISKGLECQPCFRENPSISRMPREICTNPPDYVQGGIGGPMIEYRRFYGDGLHQCMADISVDEVVEAARGLWERTK